MMVIIISIVMIAIMIMPVIMSIVISVIRQSRTRAGTGAKSYQEKAH